MRMNSGLALLLSLGLLTLGCPGDDDTSDGDDDSGDDDSGDDDTGDDDTGDDDSGDDDSGDDDSGDDDSGDDDSGGCVNGWEPLTVMLFASPRMTSMAVQEQPPRLAVSCTSALEVHDLSNPASPSLEISISDMDIGPWGVWHDVAEATWGFAVAAESADGPVALYHVLTVDDSTGSLDLGPRADVVHVAERVYVDGNRVVVAGKEGITFFDYTPGALTEVGARTFNPTLTWINAVAAVGDTALVTTGDGQVLIVPLDPLQPIIIKAATANPQALLETLDGWVIPETGNFGNGCGASIELLDLANQTLDLLAAAPCISAFDDEDGPFQAERYISELFLANSESGILRLPWTPPAITVPQTTTLTPAIWLDQPLRPQHLERFGDILAIGAAEGETIGLVRICP